MYWCDYLLVWSFLTSRFSKNQCDVFQELVPSGTCPRYNTCFLIHSLPILLVHVGLTIMLIDKLTTILHLQGTRVGKVLACVIWALCKIGMLYSSIIIIIIIKIKIKSNYVWKKQFNSVLNFILKQFLTIRIWFSIKGIIFRENVGFQLILCKRNNPVDDLFKV